MSVHDSIFSYGIFGPVPFTNCVQWSEDGMIAFASANEIKVLSPTYIASKNFYSSRWLRITNIPTTVTDKPLVRSHETLVGALRETSFKIGIRKFVWGPSSISFGVPSILTLLLTDGTLLLTMPHPNNSSIQQITSDVRTLEIECLHLSVCTELNAVLRTHAATLNKEDLYNVSDMCWLMSRISIMDSDLSCLVVTSPHVLHIVNVSIQDKLAAEVIGYWKLQTQTFIHSVFSLPDHALLVCCSDGTFYCLQACTDAAQIQFKVKWSSNELASVVDDMRIAYNQYVMLASGSDILVLDSNSGQMGTRICAFSSDITSMHILTYMNDKFVVACAIDGSICCWKVRPTSTGLPSISEATTFPVSKGCRLCVFGDTGGAMLGYGTKHIVDPSQNTPNCTLRLFRNPFVEHNICFNAEKLASFMLSYSATNNCYMGFSLFVVNACFSSMYGNCATAYCFNIAPDIEISASSMDEVVRIILDVLVDAAYISCRLLTASACELAQETLDSKLDTMLCIVLDENMEMKLKIYKLLHVAIVAISSVFGIDVDRLRLRRTMQLIYCINTMCIALDYITLSNSTKAILTRIAAFVSHHFQQKEKYNISTTTETDEQISFLVQQIRALSMHTAPIACIACSAAIDSNEYVLHCNECNEVTDRCVWSLQGANISNLAMTYQCVACKSICYQSHELVPYVFTSSMCPYCCLLMEKQDG